MSAGTVAAHSTPGAYRPETSMTVNGKTVNA